MENPGFMEIANQRAKAALKGDEDVEKLTIRVQTGLQVHRSRFGAGCRVGSSNNSSLTKPESLLLFSSQISSGELLGVERATAEWRIEEETEKSIFESSNTIDLYLHRRYYDLVDPQKYLVILLDDDQDDDAMLIAAQFCSDSFSSISFNEASTGVPYSLYTRIESIQSKEIQGTSGSPLPIFSVLECNTTVFVPFLQHEEQVYIPLTLNRISGLKTDEGPLTSVVILFNHLYNGAIWAKLHFARSWSFGRVGIGHTVYLSGLSCHLRKHSGLEATCYLASLIYPVKPVVHIFVEFDSDQVDQCHVNTRFSHSLCGHVVNKMPSGGC
ncbi:hypothetical protein OIU84_019344 [Salix udensis]|uniref:Uncharacterized protein n=1 Tax=Salix udensis TaxID=889485 RepID=A0AAD6KYL4_9ROSI|nr:hypothetical protein OIU84_019344 [Salix udensis]